MKAVWNGATLAESSVTVVVEGNHYFPPDSIDEQYFSKTAHTSFCPWKGTASYYTVTVDGQNNDNAAWFYPEPKDAAANIAGHVAFWNGVEVVE
ncbi:MAG: DUF427 domain-containing protein [Pseudomonadota bacterium]